MVVALFGQSCFLYGKNGFAKASKNLARYRFENNFIEPSK